MNTGLIQALVGESSVVADECHRTEVRSSVQ